VAVSLGEADVSEELSFVVNGRPVSLKTDGTAPLLSVLRDELKLRGTKFGCGTEQCGACMVLIDGKPEYSCSREVASVTGKAVTTLEGLAVRGALNPLQRALLDEQAGQCGYCLPGILITAKALLDKNPAPSRREIALALDDNICRCGSHVRILRAVERAAAKLRGEAGR
jgi:nicotinate dehydrogenase subunit A